MPLVMGATAAGFHIVRQLGYEEFGELYVAEHPRLPRQQVLHLIPAEISVDLDYRLRFSQESDQAATLWHPHIAGLTDRGEHEDQLWLSSEYIEGSDAAELLGDGHLDGIPPRMLVEVASAIADALDYAHDHGVLHRYVNPGNIVIGNSPADRRRIALTGFGVARPEGAHNTLTRAGMFIGTAGYTAPEQLIGEELDGRADQYGLAASAFHLLTGAPPFAHFNPSVVVNRQLNDRPPRPSEIRPDLTDYDAIFARALSKDPVDRFRRCRDFAKALESIGGTRSHIRATSEIRAASIFREPNGNGGTAIAPVPSTEAATVASAVSSNGRSHKHIDDDATAVVPAAAEQLDGDDDDDFDDFEDFDDDFVDEDEAAEARRRRLRHSAAIGGAIAVVLIAWFAGIKALRSASQHDDSPAGGENTTSASFTPAPVLSAPPVVIAPPPAPSVAAPPPPVTTSAPPTSSTTRRPTATSSAAPQTAATKPPKSTTPTSTGPNVLDTRPAIGMPCGPEGSAAVSNSGVPVTCIVTPGGSAWQPPGG